MTKESLRNLWYRLSPNQRYIIRRLYYFPIDLADRLTGKRHKYVPPRGYIYTGSAASAENYIRQGNHQLELLKNEIDLKPNDCTLDIGSGIGRTAIALTGYLDSNSKYEGFDVVKLGVDWCRKKITKDFPNFTFTYIPLFNDLYNKSSQKATNFTFPYDSDHFDKIFSFSVFTHMQVDEIQHYFAEISRVLKKEGLAFSTFFIYDDLNEDQISQNEGFSFPVKRDGFRLMSEKVTSGNIAFHQDTLKAMLEKEGLSVVKMIDGFWKDNDLSKVEYQDMLIFKKQ